SRSRQAATTLARRVPGADGIAITTSSGPVRSRMTPISSVGPRTLTPAALMPRLPGSSSTNPMARDPRLGFRRNSRATIWPPDPDVQEAQHERERERRGGEDGIGDELLGATPVDRIHQARHRLSFRRNTEASVMLVCSAG